MEKTVEEIKTVEKIKTNVVKMPTKPISRQELVDLFFYLDTKGSNFIEVWTKTIPDMRKTNNPFVGDVFKLTETNSQIGWYYDNAVNNQRDREGIEDDFTPKPRKWGKHMVNPLNGKISKVMIDHTNKKNEYKQYAQLRPLSVKSVEYEHKNGKKFTDVEIARLKEYFPPKYESKTQKTDKEIKVTDYNIDNIYMLICNKVLFVVR